MGGLGYPRRRLRAHVVLAGSVVMVLAGPGAVSAAGAVPASTGAASTGAATLTAPASAAVLWRQLWSDSFAGPAGAGISQRRWQYDTGTGIFGTGEVETMTSARANVALDGTGDLDITAVERNGTWTSGRVQTLTEFAAPPGGEMKITAAIRQPDPANGLGYWPAFWLLGPDSWPQTGEFDILEDVNGLGEHSATMHCGNLTQANGDGTFGPCREYIGMSSGLQPCPGCQTGYHTYSIVLDRREAGAEQARWYLDGQRSFTVTEAQVGPAAWTQAFDHGFSILFDLAIGGGYPDAICGCTTPTAQTSSGAALSIRNVAVYYSSSLGLLADGWPSGW